MSTCTPQLEVQHNDMQPNSPGAADRDMAHIQVRQGDFGRRQTEGGRAGKFDRGPVVVSASSAVSEGICRSRCRECQAWPAAIPCTYWLLTTISRVPGGWCFPSGDNVTCEVPV